MTELPPLPWTWQLIDPGTLYDGRNPQRPEENATGWISRPLDGWLRDPAGARGWALVAADGTPVLTVDEGWGSPEIDGGIPGPVAELLARAPELAERVRELEAQLREHPLATGTTDEGNPDVAG